MSIVAQSSACTASTHCHAHLEHCNLHAGECFGAPRDAAPFSERLPPAFYRGSSFGGRACQDAASRVSSLRLMSQNWRVKMKRSKRAGIATADRTCFGCWKPHYSGTVPGVSKSMLMAAAAAAGSPPCCRGHGDCISGVCVCRNGSFGLDCAHRNAGGDTTPAALPETAAGSRRGLAVYVYEMPATLGAIGRREPRFGTPDAMYSAESIFVEQLLSDTAVRTLDPASADLFLVPLWAVELASNTGCARGHVSLVTEHVRRRYPFWNASGGRDHVLLVTADKGGCGLGPTPAIVRK